MKWTGKIIKIRVDTLLLISFLTLIFSVIAVIGYGVYLIFVPHLDLMTTAIAPDGLHRIVVQEKHTTGQCSSIVRLDHYDGSQGDSTRWTLSDQKSISNDSSCRSNYSVVWQLDGHNKPVKVLVFGDFGSPPYKGEIIYSKDF